MGKAKFSLLSRKIDLDVIDGKMSAFARVPHALEVRMSKPLAEDGYGTVTVDGIPVSQGTPIFIDMFVKVHQLLIPVGEVVHEYGKEYTIRLTGFKAEDGTVFQDAAFKFRTMERRRQDPAYATHDDVALEAAREGMVLLKNEGRVLPLEPEETLNVFGAGVHLFRNTATGAGKINPRWQANFVQAVREHSRFRLNEDLSRFYLCLRNELPDAACIERARAAGSTVLIFITRDSGEFLDNRPIPGGYYLTEQEEAMVAGGCRAFDKTVAVINSGYPIDLRWVEQYGVNSVIYTGFAGMMAGYALVEILDGRCNPSGKLPDTWRQDYYDDPASKNFINLTAEDKPMGEKDKGVHLYYEEDIYVGYRYFDTFRKNVAYSFGHGLSYTKFDLSCGEITWNEESLTLQAIVENIGSRSGKEVVQLYVHAPDGAIEKPFRVLTAFEKTKLLSPGEKQTITLEAKADAFASFDEEHGEYVLESGEYSVYAGSSLSDSTVIASFAVPERKVLRKVNRINLPVETFHRLSRKSPEAVGLSRLTDLEKRINTPAPRPTYMPQELPAYHGKRITFRELRARPERINDFVSQMSNDELCLLNVCGGANWYMPWQNGAAGKTNVIRKYGLPRMQVSDGNNGLNISKPNIGFPSSATVCATFNKELAYQVGSVIGEESRENHIALNLGPAMNIHRNILNGRHPEYFSEDPYLAGTMAGMHAKGLVDHGTACCYKHLFCNNSDTSRKGSQSIVSERALREIYFRVFEFAMAIQMPNSMMTSYNSVNGIYPAENADILQTLLREEWGFEGYVMTDWGTYDTVDPVEMVKAGNCWLTEGSGKYVKILRKAAKEGRLSRAVLQQNVKRLVLTMLKWA